jgi:hypothetical protein
MKGIILAVLLAIPGLAFCAQPSISALSSSLSSLRDTCAKQAKDASDAQANAQFDSAQQLKTAQVKAQMDAQVYGVGHGSRETNEYLVQRLQEVNQDSQSNDEKIIAQGDADSKAVQACVADAQQKGKTLYSDFKKQNKRSPHAADDLMTAWLSNIEEISFEKPSGSAETAAAWKTSKAHAELAAL